MGTEEEVWEECSDNEEWDKLGISSGSIFSPRLEDLPDLYAQIKKNKVLDLEWSCPGRRNPNQPQQEEIDEGVDPQNSSTGKDTDTSADDFAFDLDEEPPTTRPSKPSSIFKQKGPTTKRKTTTLAGILSNMERHRIIERRMDSDNVNNNNSQKPE